MKWLAFIICSFTLTTSAQPLTQNDVVWGYDSVIGSFISDFSTTNDFILIADVGPATPYPVNLPVSGLTGVVVTVTVTLSNLIHNFPTDMQFLIVSPNSLSVKILGGAGGTSPIGPTTLTFSDAASMYAPDGLAAGTYLPTDGQPSFNFPFLAVGPYPTNLSTFSGMGTGDANGLWKVYVADANALDGGFVTNVTLHITQ